MKKAKKIVALLLCALLLVGASIAGTIAYLTSTPGAVTNTFTVGNVTITLDESRVDAYGENYLKENGTDSEGNPKYDVVTDVEDADSVYANTYKLIPGHEYIKNPTVHVDANSEKCYVFVKVINGIEVIEEKDGSTEIAEQIAANGWTELPDVDNVYYMEAVEGGTNLPVFETFTLATNATVANYGGANITVTAYAIQADGIADAKTAWTNGGFSS